MRRSTTKASNDGWFWTNLRIYTPFRALAVTAAAATLTVGCGREGGMAREIDSTMPYDTLPAAAPRPVKPAEKLAVAATKLGELASAQRKRDLTTAERKQSAGLRRDVARSLDEVIREFAVNKTKLEGLGADDALERLAVIDGKAKKLQSSLSAALADLPAARRAPEAAREISRALAAVATPPPAQSLSTDVGFGDRNENRKPVSLDAGITPAYRAPIGTDAVSALPSAAQPEDLSETPETKVTPQVSRLVQHLDRDPVKIFAWVRNKVRFEPYYGVRKGADTTLSERSGSDADQAALLIALLRASGVHARFVKGVAELPVQTVANWVGVDTQAGELASSAPEILAAGGFPTTSVRANGEPAKVRFEHVWVEAYVPQAAYRGVEESVGGKRWAALDPSIKENVLTQPKVDVRQALAPAIEALGTSFVQKSAAVGDSGVRLPTEAQLRPDLDRVVEDGTDAVDAVDDISDPADLLGSVEIKTIDLPYLPGSVPFIERSVQGEWRAAPQSLVASVSVSVAGSDPLSTPAIDPEQDNATGFAYTARASELAGRRVTLAYVPATPEDAEILDAYHGMLNAPAYAASLIPVLRVNGAVVARGHQPVSTGYAQKLTITYRSPGFAPDVVENPVYVGSLSAIALAVGPTSPKQLKARAEQLQSLSSTVSTANVLTDSKAGELMSVLGSYYFARNDVYDAFMARVAGVNTARGLSGSIVAADVGVALVAGFPVSTRFAGLTMDVDQDVSSVVAKRGGAAAETRFLQAAGMNASASESEVFKPLGGGTVSTAAIMEKAVKDGVPFVPVTSQNVARIDQIVNVSEEVKREITRAVNEDGARVTIPKTEITLGGWRGSGYIIDQGSTLQYRISGGLNGGHFTPGAAGEYDLLAAFVAAIKADLSALADAIVWLANTIMDGLGIFANCSIAVLDNIEQRQTFLELMMMLVAALSVDVSVAATGAIALSFVLPPIWPILAFAVLTIFLFAYYSQDGCLDAVGDEFE